MAVREPIQYEWERGEQRRFAQAADLSPAYLNDVLHRRGGRARIGAVIARRLADACKAMAQENPSFPIVTLEQWLFPDEHFNPLLF